MNAENPVQIDLFGVSTTGTEPGKLGRLRRPSGTSRDKAEAWMAGPQVPATSAAPMYVLR